MESFLDTFIKNDPSTLVEVPACEVYTVTKGIGYNVPASFTVPKTFISCDSAEKEIEYKMQMKMLPFKP